MRHEGHVIISRHFECQSILHTEYLKIVIYSTVLSYVIVSPLTFAAHCT